MNSLRKRNNKREIPNSKSQINEQRKFQITKQVEEENQQARLERTKPYDLEERTALFAEDVRKFSKRLPRTLANEEDSRQLIKASGSVGANYIEANESLSKKDFYYRCKVCRKESKESAYFLRLIDTGTDSDLETERRRLRQEAIELKLIFNKMIGSN